MENDNVKHPAHYCDGGIETIDIMRAKLTYEEFQGFCKGCTLKYVLRDGKKPGADDDLEKAERYLHYANEERRKRRTQTKPSLNTISADK